MKSWGRGVFCLRIWRLIFFFFILWLIYYELKNQICDGISLIHLISDLQVSMVVIRGDVNNGL